MKPEKPFASSSSNILEAAEKGDWPKVSLLLRGNPGLIFSKADDGRTPLHNAAANGHKDVVELLLSSKAKVNSKDKNSRTPLHHCAGDTEVAKDRKDVAALLLARKAEVNAKDKDGVTPLHYAADTGRKDVAELLLANKAEVNAKDKDGTTPLHLAASLGHKDVAELLLANSAEVNAKTHTGLTPLHHAALKGFKHVAELLLVNGAEVNAKNDDGTTPLHLAASLGFKDVAELLLTKGADVNPATNNATHQSGQPVAPESIYTQLSQTLQKPVDEMLSFLETAIETRASASAERDNLFLVDFLAKANGFAERCCGSYAELLRHCSRLPEVRGTPTVTLANQIRAEVFSKYDAILEQCQRHLHSSADIIANVSAHPQEPGLITTALQGAATGQLAAGLGKRGKTVGAVGAVLAVSEQWNRRTALLSE